MVRALVLGLVALAFSPPSHVTVTSDGRIGPLHVDTSMRAQVIAFAGRPESEVFGRYDSAPPFDALGYGCAGRRATGQDGVPMCKTVFYIDVRSGRLALLWTTDPRYANQYGVHVGTPTAAVERVLHRTVIVGCLAQVRLSTTHAFLDLTFAGGRARLVHRPTDYLHLVGGRVGALVVDSQSLSPGVLDCIDS